MSTIKHITQGVQIVQKNWTLVAIAYSFKFGLSLLFLIPLQGLVSNAFSYRPVAGLLLKDWNLTPIIDFIYRNQVVVKQYGSFIVVGIILTLILHIFLSGGFFRSLTLSQDEEYSSMRAQRFFGWCGRYFWPLLKIAVISAIFYIVITFLFIIFSTLGMRLIVSDFTSEPVKIMLALGRLVVLLLLLLVINMIMTYVKIAAVTDDEPQALNALGKTFEFLSKSFRKAFTLYGGLLLGLLALLVIYWILQKGCGLFSTTLTIVTLFLIQQFLSLTRSWYRLIGYASQINLYVNNRAIR